MEENKNVAEAESNERVGFDNGIDLVDDGDLDETEGTVGEAESEEKESDKDDGVLVSGYDTYGDSNIG